MKLNKTETAIAAGILTAVILCGLFPGIFFTQDKWLSDLLCQRPSVTEKKIYIIAIDDKTLKEYGALTSWNRIIPANLVIELDKGDTRPAVIAFDVIYSEKGNGDALFAKVCQKYGNVVTAMNFRFREMPELGDGGQVVYNPFHVEYAVFPYSPLYEAVQVGFANTFLDNDGYVRRALLRVDYDGKAYYSLAGEIYKSYRESLGQEAVFPELDANGLFHFSYSGKSGGYSMVSMADVLDGTVDPKLFADAIVLVGACAEGLQDA